MLSNKSVRKALLAVSVVCIFVMTVLVILEYREPVYKSFSAGSFYTGYVGEEGDPKSAWEDINGTGVIGRNACDTVMKLPLSYDKGPSKVCGRYTWLSLGDAPKDAGGLSKYQAGSNSVLKPYEQDDYIISPAKLIFRNSNVDQSLVTADEGTYIEAYAGAEYVIRWSNVYCWYCHIGKENVNKHTDVLGYNGSNQKTAAGYVIGQANRETTVSLFTYDADGNLSPASWGDFYFKFNVASNPKKPPKTPNPKPNYDFVTEEVTIPIKGVSKEYKIAWVSDLHLISDHAAGTKLGDVHTEDLGAINERYKKLAVTADGVHAEELWPEIIKYLNYYSLDGAIFGGDLMDYCSNSNIAAVKAGLDKLSIPYIYIRADHDYGAYYGGASFTEDEARALHQTIDGG